VGDGGRVSKRMFLNAHDCSNLDYCSSLLLLRNENSIDPLIVRVRTLKRLQWETHGGVKKFYGVNTPCGRGIDNTPIPTELVCLSSGLAREVPSSSNLFNAASSNLTVLLRVVQCSGNEDSLLDCLFQLNNGACGHDQDAGVICLGDRANTTSTSITPTTPAGSTTTLPPRICKQDHMTLI